MTRELTGVLAHEITHIAKHKLRFEAARAEFDPLEMT